MMCRIALCLLGMTVYSGFAFESRADVLLIERAQAAAQMDLPRRGELMPVVAHRFGEPAQRHAAVGGASPQQPPITRWDYANFSVYFENDHVVCAVLNKSQARETGPKPTSSDG